MGRITATRKACIVFALVLGLAGCSVKVPSDVIPQGKMENLLYDYYIAKSLGDNMPYTDSYKKELYTDAVFKKYSTTQAEFDSSMVWYTRHTEILSKVYSKVSERLKAQQDVVNHLVALRDKTPKTTAAGDSVDVWPWLRIMRLTGEEMDSKYIFTLPTDSNYHERDTLVWTMDYRFLPPLLPDSLRRAVMSMQLIYAKDTLHQLAVVTASGEQQLRLYADTLGALKEIKGFIYYAQADSLVSGPLLASRISMMRYHCKDSLTFAQRDSLNKADSLRRDSLAKHPPVAIKADSLKQGGQQKVSEMEHRLSPEEMNRRRTGAPKAKKPEQIEVEQHIRQEQIEQERVQQMNQRRRQPQRRRPGTTRQQ
ncbi:MAG: DUF4296 domain-containing protein [Mediterranea sp.]|jgi:hypothetical protein|nr:DUF4296 domain-containing protein [Mediterranea sp.]